MPTGMKSSGTLWFGIILVAFGVLMLLDNMYVVDFSEVIHTYWPLVLVIWGLSMLWRRSNGWTVVSAPPGEVPNATSTVYPGTDAMKLSSSTVFGDYTVAVQSKSFTGGSVSTTFGDIDVDLLSAQLADGDHALKIDGVFGDTCHSSAATRWRSPCMPARHSATSRSMNNTKTGFLRHWITVHPASNLRPKGCASPFHGSSAM